MPTTDKGPTITDSACTALANKPQKEQHQRSKCNRQQLLKRPCICGRTHGRHYVIKSRRPSTKEVVDARGNRISKKIKTKYPPLDSGPSEAYWAAKELDATMTTVGEMLPFVTKRYPSLLIRDADYAKALRINAKIYRPWIDERFSKDWISWWLIALDASAYGYNAAASKNAIKVRMPNGKVKRVKLTPEYIRDRLNVAHEVAEEFVKYMPAYIEFLDVWSYIVSNDKVVKKEFLRKLEENKKSILIVREENSSSSGAAGNNSSYEYKYHYIIHYDRKLYKQDKKTQGKVKCGPFNESEIHTFF